MFKGEITTDYTGTSAFWEILIMLFVAFVLGWLARMFWEKIISFHNKIDENVIEKVIDKKIEEKKIALLNKKAIEKQKEIKDKEKKIQVDIVSKEKQENKEEKKGGKIIIEEDDKVTGLKNNENEKAGEEKDLIETKKREKSESEEMTQISEIIEKKEQNFDEKEEKEEKIKIKRVKDEQNPFKLLKNDDLKIIEGIGPKIEILLKNAGIITWEDLAKTKVDKLRFILKEGGDRFSFHNPETWPEQASLAVKENWEELAEFQEFLSGGKVK